MSDYRVAVPYAKSLLALAEEKNVLEEVHQDMLLIRNTCEASRELRLLLSNPIVNHSKKLSILNTLFGGKVGEISQMFFQILCKKGRESVLYAISEQVHELYNRMQGIVKAEVITPIALTDELRREFAAAVEKVSSKKVELHEKVDESLIGGYILRMEGKQIDDSVRTRLKELRKSLIS